VDQAYAEANPDRIKWLWGKFEKQDYAFDDPGKAAGAEIFLRAIYDRQSECYQYGDKGYVVLTSIVQPVNAIIHFMIWDDFELSDVVDAATEILDHVFLDLKLERLTAAIPAGNRQAIRLATLNRFRYEGEMKRAFLKNGSFSNVQIYGLLREDYVRRGVKN
jgi:RimJ/RimL family protein N-acetyltransferase